LGSLSMYPEIVAAFDASKLPHPLPTPPPTFCASPEPDDGLHATNTAQNPEATSSAAFIDFMIARRQWFG